MSLTNLPVAILIDENNKKDLNNIYNIKDIDDITEYMNKLIIDETNIEKIKNNIKFAKELNFIYGKLCKEENKKYVITNEYKREIDTRMQNLRQITNQLITRNVKQKNYLIKTIFNMTPFEFENIFQINQNAEEYQAGLNS